MTRYASGAYQVFLQVYRCICKVAYLATVAAEALYGVRGRPGEKISVLEENEANISNRVKKVILIPSSPNNPVLSFHYMKAAILPSAQGDLYFL